MASYAIPAPEVQSRISAVLSALFAAEYEDDEATARTLTDDLAALVRPTGLRLHPWSAPQALIWLWPEINIPLPECAALLDSRVHDAYHVERA
jgi:hypothetical protein